MHLLEVLALRLGLGDLPIPDNFIASLDIGHDTLE